MMFQFETRSNLKHRLQIWFVRRPTWQVLLTGGGIGLIWGMLPKWGLMPLWLNIGITLASAIVGSVHFRRVRRRLKREYESLQRDLARVAAECEDLLREGQWPSTPPNTRTPRT